MWPADNSLGQHKYGQHTVSAATIHQYFRAHDSGRAFALQVSLGDVVLRASEMPGSSVSAFACIHASLWHRTLWLT